jgi:hypothetical protein
MAQQDNAWAAEQRRRWMRPNAHLYVRPDAWRFMPAGAPKYLGKDAVHYFWPEAKRDRPPHPVQPVVDAELCAERDELLRLRSELLSIKADIKFLRFIRALKGNFNPNQPRVPAGDPDGGQWASEQEIDGETADQITAEGSDDTDFSAQRRSRADGHHYVPRALYDNLPLPPETREVFEEAKTGRLYDIQSNKFDAQHRRYNDAVSELFEDFAKRNGVQPERMTPDQARSFRGEVLTSQDPRIRNYNMLIQMREIMQRIFRRPLRSE